ALPLGTRIDNLNLRWLDADGAALPANAHPTQQLLRGEAMEFCVRVGLVPPTGGTRWLKATLRSVRLPDEALAAALLVLDEADR
ncbi:MAG: hypothetical protein Q8M07_10870, partial [Prosthecobacter sp.]|nr:hypothetical protein [Prosthecobacter sp.]